MTEHQVLIAGAGPTGLMLAGELALGGADVAILERRPDHALTGLRAGGLHSRTIELLQQRGIADRFLSAGQIAQIGGFSLMPLDISDFATRHPYGLGLRQREIERLLAQWVRELGVPIHHGCELAQCDEDETGVTVTLDDGRLWRSRYLVGCDGGRSTVRKLAGIAFPGWDATTSSLIAEVRMREKPAWGFRRDALGLHAISRVDYAFRDGQVVYADEGPIAVMVTEPRVGGGGEPTLHDLKDALLAVYGSDFGVCEPTWISRFSDMTRQAAAYRKGRVLLAGDAAHVHAPDGGQGLNLGMQDAVNLGWKLAQVVSGISDPALLDSYHAERHPAGARALRHTMAQVALRRPDERTEALRETMAELLNIEGARKHLAVLQSGLGVRYDLGDGHPLVGRRMPDLELGTSAGPLQASSLLHSARGALLVLAPSVQINMHRWAGRVQLVHARYEGAWELADRTPIPAPHALLVRPDGHVAWVGDPTDRSLKIALATWFGQGGPARDA